MFMAKDSLVLFVSLAIGYVLCILADKQKKGLLRTLGYTFGAAIIAMSLLYSAGDSYIMKCKRWKMWHGNKGMKCSAGMLMKGKMK